MANRTVEIRITAENKASGVIDRVVSSLSGLGHAASGAGGHVGLLGRVMETSLGVGLGNMVSGAFHAITGAIGGFIGQAKDAVGRAQSLEIALTGLLTESLMYQKVTEQQQVAISLTDKEREKLTDLTLARTTANAKIQEQQERIRQLTEQYGEEGLAVIKERARLAEMIHDRDKMSATIDTLAGKEGKLVTVMSESIQQTMSFGDAQAEAERQSKELLAAISKLAIISPFETSQVEQIASMGLMANMSTKEVEKFTGAFLDYAAVHGITSSNLAFAADQFLQLAKIGKITTIDMRQLRRLGIDVSKILGVDLGMSAEELTKRFGELGPEAAKVFSGMSVEEFNAAVEKSPELMDVLFDKFTAYAEETSQGAAQKMAMTISGMMATGRDIVELGSRALFRPIIEAVSPAAAGMLGKLADAVTGGKLEEIGKQIGDKLTAYMANFQSSGIGKFLGQLGAGFATLKRQLQAGAGPAESFARALTSILPRPLWAGIVALGKGLDKFGKAAGDLIKGVLGGLRDWFSENAPHIAAAAARISAVMGALFGKLAGEGPAAEAGLGGLLSTILDVGLKAFEGLAAALEFVAEHWEAFKVGLLTVAAILGGGAIIGAIGGIVAAINPVTLVIAGIAAAVAVLYEAWTNNWGGIRDTVTGAVDKIKAVIAQVGAAIGPTIDVLSGIFDKLKSGFEKGGLSGLVDAFKDVWPDIKSAISKGLQSAWSVLGPILSSVGAKILAAAGQWGLQILTALGNVLGVDLVGLFETVKETIGNAGASVGEAFGTITAAVAPVWEGIKAVVSSAVAVIWPAIQTFVEGIKGALPSLAPVLESFKGLWEAIKPVVLVVLGAIGGAAVTAVGVIVGVFNGLAAAIGPIIEGVAGALSGIVDVITGVVNVIVGTVELIWGALTGNEEAVAAAWEKIKAGVATAWNGIVTTITSIVSGLWNAVSGFLEGFARGIYEFFKGIYDRLVGHSIIPDLINAIVDWFRGLPEKAKKAILSGLGKLLEAGREIVEGLKEGIENAWDGFINWIKGKIEGVVKSVLAALGIQSPPPWAIDAGAQIVKGLRIGMAGQFGALGKTVAEMGAIATGATFGAGRWVPAALPTMPAARGSAGAAPGGGSSTSLAGDTYNVNVFDQAAAAMLLHQAQARKADRLNRGMGR